MKVSAVLSIHNRTKLFRRALEGYLWQTMPREDWELVIVDDMSDESIPDTFKHLIGRANIRYVRMDHTRHPIFKKRNPEWKPGDKEDWFHTPSLSTNIGTFLSKGDVLCICHPEILHAPTNFAHAHGRLSTEKAYLIGTTHLGTPASNDILDADPAWTRDGWNAFLSRIMAGYLEKHLGMYWYTSFIPKAAVEAIGGVDFEYLNGVAGEDDDFRERATLAGWTYVHDRSIEGFHQDHSKDKDSWTFRAEQEKARFDAALNRNRALLFARWGHNRPEFGPAPCPAGFPQPANQGHDWTAKECIVSVDEYPIS